MGMQYHWTMSGTDFWAQKLEYVLSIRLLFQGDLIDSRMTSDEIGCLNHCAHVDECHWYSFERSVGTCHLMRNCPSLNNGMVNYISGQVECQVEEPYSITIY